MKYLKTFNIIGVLLLLSVSTKPANAVLTLVIDNYTTDELSFTINGAFDADTISDSSTPGYLAIKNDWLLNEGTHTDLFSSTPMLTNNTITIGGVSPGHVVNNFGWDWADSFYYRNISGVENAFTAGTIVSGSVTLSGTGMFDPADAVSLQLVSGFSTTSSDWVRLEANAVSAVPVPAAVWLMGSALVGLTGFSRRKETTA